MRKLDFLINIRDSNIELYFLTNDFIKILYKYGIVIEIKIFPIF